MFYQKVVNHFVHDIDLVPSRLIDDDPHASLKRSIQIFPYLEVNYLGCSLLIK